EAAAEASPQAPNAARGDLDAVVLAGAGLKRLGMEHHIAELLPPEVMLPAPGQGALAVEVRAEDAVPVAPLGFALALYDDIPARLETSAERGMLARLNAGCSAPIGGLARYADNPDGGATLRLDSVICAPDGTQVQRAGGEIAIEAGAERSVSVERAIQLGTSVAEQLLAEDFGLLKHVVDS
ncbi:hydroxymethylbilane synthase, partial [Nesterenkonia halotolerans]